jgi:hypothetical protein
LRKSGKRGASSDEGERRPQQQVDDSHGSSS